MKDNILLLGAGGHGLVLAEIAKSRGYKKICFLDDQLDKKYPYEIIGKINDYPFFIKDFDFFVSIGINEIRKKIFTKILYSNCTLVNLIHPTAIVAESVNLSKGIAIMPNAVINSMSKIGLGSIVNTSASIDHESVVGDFVHISPGCCIAGKVTICDMSWLGIGCNVINGITICENCIIGGGTTVIESINMPGTYVGTPIRRIDK